MLNRRRPQAACSALAIASFVAICAASAGPVRQIAGLSLIGASAFALWLMRRGRFDAMVPATGLTLVFLILTGLALAAVHILSTIPIALAATLATLAALWAGTPHPIAESAERSTWLQRLTPSHLLAVTGVLIFAAATVLAVHHSASSARVDADGASSVAIWAYPSGDQLHVGVQQPAGHGATSLRIIVTEAGVTVATWNVGRLAPGQTWEAPALTVAGKGPAHVVAMHGGTVVASLSSK
jgi:hypothetical protein